MAAPLDLGAVRAILSDLDGTLVDSTQATERVWNGWKRDRGLPTGAPHPHGIPAREVVQLLAPALDAIEEAAELERREIADTDGVVALPGAAALLAADATWGLEIAIVTSCTAALAETRLRIAGLAPPSIVVTAERTERVKPDPDPYLLAAELLGLEPADCLVLEDAPAGIAAGRAAGMQVVAVTTSHVAAQLSDAHHIADDVAELLALLPVRVSPGPEHFGTGLC
ncbi:MAG: HAD-IA family hydrolase [Solirubrobacteraceae bacterium]|nr:HAD-IA family hydrolase [Solirubrobacteraceae bacterium]